MSRLTASRRLWIGLAAAIVLAVIAYWPSLHGGFVFDDFPNIVDNSAVHLQSLDWQALRTAATASPSHVLVRPLAMLSFALDWYASGGDPLRMKIENLLIHLINGLLLFGLLRSLLRARKSTIDSARLDALALCVTAAWLLAPINFTAVAYIVQRMESLCQMFVLTGLWGYIAARRRMLDGRPGFARAALSIVLGTALGVLAKESAVLLPLYALLVEWCVFAFARANGQRDRRLFALYLVVLVLPATLAAYWISRHALPAAAWANRPFTLGQRLLTEPRILWDYVQWSLLPMANRFSLYHDHVRLSYGLLQPPTTLLAILGLIAAFFAAVLLRRSRPWVALGIFWFFAAHLLTATVIPLELVYEHRNYFASIGLYLAVFAVLIPPTSAARVPLVRIAVCCVVPLFFASVTAVRALNWGNPVMFALSEAQLNPHSPRAAYELARTYVILSQYHVESPLIPDAYKSLEHAATMPGADALPDQGLLLLSGRLHREPPQGTWERMQNKLATQPISAQNVSALYALNRCVLDGDCVFPAEQMVASFLAALQHTPPDTRVLSIYASYAFSALHDATLALDLARTAVKPAPRDMQMRRNRLLLLAASGDHQAAQAFYEQTVRELPQAARDAKFRALLDTPKSVSIAPLPTP
jgi:hypothetical protein